MCLSWKICGRRNFNWRLFYAPFERTLHCVNACGIIAFSAVVQMALLIGMMQDSGLGRVPLITDRRFSGVTQGACIGHVSPEAYADGTIAFVEDDDVIESDINKKTLHLHVFDYEALFFVF